MERLADYLLRLYPIEYVPLKRRITFHVLFWVMMYVINWIGIGFTSDFIIYRFVLALSITFYSFLFFYLWTYLLPNLYEKYSGIVLIVSITFVISIFYLFLALESYIRVSFVVENNLISSTKSMYELNYKTYKAGFWYYFKFESMLSDTMIAILYSLPAFFLKFFRIFAKNLSEKKQLELDFLRLQINPHFLVNTLNNIYSLVVIEDQRSPDAILSLSNLLNYVL